VVFILPETVLYLIVVPATADGIMTIGNEKPPLGMAGVGTPEIVNLYHQAAPALAESTEKKSLTLLALT